MIKLVTYTRYLIDYLKHGDLDSVVASVKYVINKTSHSTDRTIHTSIGTFYCRKNTTDFMFANYYCEWGVKKFILKHKNEFTVFIDAGSCIGDYSILLSQMGKRCYAFEPIPENLVALRKNLSLNELQDKVKVFPFGLGDENYSTSYSFDPVNTGASRVDRVKNETSDKAQICKLDSIMPEMKINRDESIFMKIDIEGMEVEAIRGAANFIRFYPKITLTIEDKHIGSQPIKDILSDIAFFEFGRVDRFNLYAKKIKNYNNTRRERN